MKLVKWLASEVKHYHWWQPGEKVVVAVSTGVDSMVLLTLLEKLRNYRPNLTVAHVNHELRSASKTEEAYLRKYCRRRHLNLRISHWAKARHPRHGVEDAARQFRYRFFQRVMNESGASVLLTAHHLNDQAETILMRLIRGGDLNELTGIHRCRRFAGGQLIRPLLPIPKQRLRAFAIAHHVTWFEDQTNASLAMTRNRMRHLLLPRMKKENPRVLFHFGQFADQLTDLIKNDRDLNRRLLDSLKIQYGCWLKLSPLLRLPVNIQRGILTEFLSQFYPRVIVSPAGRSEILRLINDRSRPQGRLQLNHQFDLVKSYRQVGVTRSLPSRPATQVRFSVHLNHWYRLLNGEMMGLFSRPVGKRVGRQVCFARDQIRLPLLVRISRGNDRLRLKNGGHQKIRRVWIDQKIPNVERRKSQVLETQDHLILALLGYKEAVLPKSNGKNYTLIVKGNSKGVGRHEQ